MRLNIANLFFNTLKSAVLGGAGPASGDGYLLPDGISFYILPDGASFYLVS